MVACSPCGDEKRQNTLVEIQPWNQPADDLAFYIPVFCDLPECVFLVIISVKLLIGLQRNVLARISGKCKSSGYTRKKKKNAVAPRGKSLSGNTQGLLTYC